MSCYCRFQATPILTAKHADPKDSPGRNAKLNFFGICLSTIEKITMIDMIRSGKILFRLIVSIRIFSEGIPLGQTKNNFYEKICNQSK